MIDMERIMKEPIGSIFCPQYCDSPIQIRDRTSLEAARILFEGMADEIEKREPTKSRQTKAKGTKAEPVTESVPPEDLVERKHALEKVVKATIRTKADISGRTPVIDVIGSVELQGYTKAEIQKTINSFLRLGEAMEPKNGVIKLI